MPQSSDTESMSTVFDMKIVAVVVTFNRKEYLLRNIEALLGQVDAETDILIVDNASTDGTKEAVAPYRNAGQILYYNTGENLGGAGGFNYGIRRAYELGYDYFWLMDDDVYPEPDALSQLIRAHEDLNGDYGYLAGVVLWRDGTECRMNKLQPKNSGAGPDEMYKRIDFSTFVSLFLPRQTVEEFGLPITEFFIWGDDIEFTRRITAKRPAYMVPDSKVLHDTKNNEGFNIAADDGVLDRYRYAYRNEMFTARKEGARRVCRQGLRLTKHIALVLFTSKGRKREKIKLIRSATKEGRSFHPAIEYVKRGKNLWGKQPMNVVFASGDQYSRLAIVTIKSLLMNNTEAPGINIYYISNGISEESQQYLKDLVAEYNRKIVFIPFPSELDSFPGSNRNGQTVFSYCFFQDILPSDVDKVLLLEGDTIVTGSLEDFYETDLSDYYIAAADDLQSKWYKRKLGMRDDSPYVNCGVILYNLKKWREDNITEKIIDVLNSGEHMFFYDVQDVINYTLEGGIKVFPPKFNCTTAIFLFDYKNMLRYRHPSTPCTEMDFKEGRREPVVVHFTKNQVIQPRPWIEYCDHPYRDHYMRIREQTVIKDDPLLAYDRENLNKWAYIMYTRMSKGLTASVLGIVHSFLYPVFLYRFLFRDK